MKKDRFALITVSDKTGIDQLARALVSAGYKIIATGGTAKYLATRNIPVLAVEELTGFPEILDGRVKTLHPAIFGGLLAKNKKHLSELEKFSIRPIDIAIVSFYPFEKFIRHSAKTFIPDDKIDIGGVAVLRAAAKNYKQVLAVSSVEQYGEVMDCLRRKKAFSPTMRKKFAALAFEKTSQYDSLIASAFFSSLGTLSEKEKNVGTSDLTLPIKNKIPLRYGENPHQKAVFCSDRFSSLKIANIITDATGIRESFSDDIESLGHKEISYNNLLDAESGISLLREISTCPGYRRKFGCAIIKHTNPCGVAVSRISVADAYIKALETDRVSAFGGVVVFNSTIDSDCATELTRIFTDCVIAPDFTDDALKLLLARKNLAVIKIRQGFTREFDIRTCLGGILLQERDTKLVSSDLKVVTKKKPTDEEMKSLLFAYAVAKHSRSNAIVLAADGRTLGVGAGLTSRIDAFRLAAAKMRSWPASCGLSHKIVLASDGFFPFDDVVREAAALDCGIQALIQPGGSIRDADSIKACDELGLAMVFAGIRHFRH